MVHKDGNIGAWLDEQQASIAKLSAKDIGFQLVPGWLDTFLSNLQQNRDAQRLNRDILTKCPVPLLAQFIVLIVGTNIEDALIRMTDERGRQLKTGLRAAARNLAPREKQPAKLFLEKAEQSFDTRRRGLAEYCFGFSIVRGYLRSKSGLEPTARELSALVTAGLVASGKAPFYRAIDHDLLRRNLKNYERRHTPPSGAHCIEIIETPNKPR
jgi:hypothetical protein